MSLLGSRLPLIHDRVHRPWLTKKDVKSQLQKYRLTFLGHWQTAGGREQREPRAIIKVLSPHCTKPVPREITREGNGTQLQHSCLENPMDGGAWLAAVHGFVKSWARLSHFTFTFHFHTLEKAMAPPLVLLPGESQGQRSLVGCRLWGRTESDTTEAT